MGNKTIKPTVKPISYLLGVAVRVFYEMTFRNKEDPTPDCILEKLNPVDDIMDKIELNSQIQMVNKYIKKLPEYCQKLLARYFEEDNVKILLMELGYSTRNALYQNKYQCRERLRRKMMNNAECRAMFNFKGKKDDTGSRK